MPLAPPVDGQKGATNHYRKENEIPVTKAVLVAIAEVPTGEMDQRPQQIAERGRAGQDFCSSLAPFEA